MFDFGDTPAQQTQAIVVILNRAVPLFLAGPRRRRSPSAWACSTSASRASTGWPPSSRPASGAAVALPAPAARAADHRRGHGGRRPVGLDRRDPQGDPRCERGDQLDHAQLHRAGHCVLPAHRPAPGQRGGRGDHHDRTTCRSPGWFPGLNGLFDVVGLAQPRGELYGFLAVAVVAGIVISVLLKRTRFGFDLRATGLSPSAATASGVDARGMVVKTMLISGAVAGLIGLPDLLGDTYHFGTEFTAGPGLPRHRRRAAGPQLAPRHRLRRAAVRLPRPRGGAAAVRGHPGLGRHDHPGHDRARRRHRQRDRPAAHPAPGRAGHRPGRAARPRDPTRRPDRPGGQPHRRAPGGRSMSHRRPPRRRRLTADRGPLTELLMGGGPAPPRRLDLRRADAADLRSSGSISGEQALTSSSTFATALLLAVPIGLAALGGLFSERAGVVEHRPRRDDDPGHLGRRLRGLPVGLGRRDGRRGRSSARLGGLLHAIATVTFGVDHVVSGVAINILAAGIVRFLSELIYIDNAAGGGVTQSPPLSSRPPELLAAGAVRGPRPARATSTDQHWFLVSRRRRPAARRSPAASASSRSSPCC